MPTAINGTAKWVSIVVGLVLLVGSISSLWFWAGATSQEVKALSKTVERQREVDRLQDDSLQVAVGSVERKIQGLIDEQVNQGKLLAAIAAKLEVDGE